MAVIDQFLGDGTRVPLEPVRGARMVLRLCQRIVGAGLIIAAAMLWVAPGAIWDWDLVLFKLALSLVTGLGGMALLSAARGPKDQVEVEVDVVRREVRVVRISAEGRDVQTCAFADLAQAELSHDVVGLWDQSGQHLADVAVRDRAVRRVLVSALSDAGKL